MSRVTVKLISSDNIEFAGVDIQTASCSKTLQTMFENLGVDEDSCEEIPVPNATGTVLKLFLQWAERQPEPKGAASDDNKSWRKEFFENMDTQTLVELTKAANYLDCETLLDACTTAIAQILQGKTPAQMRDAFRFPTQFAI